jgi:serine protease inhibitor
MPDGYAGTDHRARGLRAHAGDIRELASRWLDAVLSDPARRAAGGDVVCSPAGLWLALATIACGADGETADELAELLGLAGPEAAPAVTAAARELAATDALAVATGVFSRVDLEPGYVSALPDVAVAPLGDRAAIDAWVAEATGGLITALPADVPPDALLVLAGVLALTARWAAPFDPAATRPRRFTPAGGPGAEVPMMHRRLAPEDAWTMGGRDGEVVVAELACAGRDGARVRFALGPPGAPPASVMAAAWAPRDTGEPVTADRVTLAVPRFALRTHLDVTAHLPGLGVRLALGADADFRPLSAEALRIDQVVQESVLKVAEEGVEAAAVTQITMTRAAYVRPRQVLDVVLDRPFACAVVDASGRVPLFAAWLDRVPAGP